MKTLITGASGLLGSACVEAFSSRGIDAVPIARESLWSLPRNELASLLSGASWVLHAAANTNVEACEIDPDSCYRDNFLLTERIAAACAEADVPMVYVSSTGVYGDHATTPYREYSEVRPTTHHHRAKVLGEEAVLRAHVRNLVIRTGWLFGGAFANPKNFVARRLEEAARALGRGEPMRSNSEQRGCPTYTVDVAERLLLLVQQQQRGVFNLVNEGDASRLEYVQAILEAGGSPLRVEPATAASFSRKARVSPNETAVNWRAQAMGLPPMPDWRSSLRRYVTQRLSKESSGVR